MSDREALAMGTALQSWPNPREAKAIKKEISGSFDAEVRMDISLNTGFLFC